MQVPGGLFVAVMAAAAAENGVVGLETMSTSPRDTAGWIDGSATELAIAACFVALLALCAGKREKHAADDWAAALGGGDSVGFHGSASLDGATGDETRGNKGKTGFKATKRRVPADVVDLDPKASTTMMTNPLAPKGFGDQWSYKSSASRQEDPMSQESLDGYIAYQGAPRPYQPTIPSVPRGRNNKVTKRRTTSNPDDPGRTASESPPVIAGMGVTPLLTLHTESQESVLDDVTIAGDDAPSAVVPSAPASAQPSLSAPGYLTIDDDEMSAASSSDGPGVYADAQAVTPEAPPPPRNVYAVPTDLTVTDPERHPSATMTSRQARATLHTTTSSGEMSPREAQELVAGVDGGALSRSDAQAILGMETAGYVNASAANPGYVNVATQRRLTAGADHDNAATATYYKNYATAEAAPPSVPDGGGESTAGREAERRSTSSEVYDTFKKATDMDTKTFMEHLFYQYRPGSTKTQLVRTPSNRKDELVKSVAAYAPRQLARANVVKGAIAGAGSFGTVFCAVLHDAGHEVPVAVKELKPGIDEKAKVHFLQEAYLLAQLCHPNICAMIGGIFDEEPEWIVMELCEESLLSRVRVKEHSPLQKTNMCLDVARGCSYLLLVKFVHRDLAARNILVDTELRCKIADFGLACPLAADKDYYKSSGGKIPLRWCAPECINFRKYSSWSDVWAFGVIMYEVFSDGEVPFSGIPNRILARRVTDGLRLKAPMFCPQRIYDLSVRCWAEDPLKRTPVPIVCAELESIITEKDFAEVQSSDTAARRGVDPDEDSNPYELPADSTTREPAPPPVPDREAPPPPLRRRAPNNPGFHAPSVAGRGSTQL